MARGCEQFLGVVRRRRGLSTMAGPVGVVEFAGVAQEFVGVSAKVIALCLKRLPNQKLTDTTT